MMWEPLVWPATAFVVTAAVALGLRWALLSMLARWGEPRPGRGAFGDAVRVPSFLWCLVLAFYVAVEIANLPHRLALYLGTLLQASIVVSVTVTLANLSGSLVSRYGDRLGVAVTGLAQTSARLAVLIIGLLVLLSTLGIQITPLLTALGVGGLAVALALQDTLSNLFAGMHVLAGREVRPGDYIRLSEGIEGHVVDIGWRTTRLRTQSNNIVIVPNRTVAQATITNFTLPLPLTAVSIRVDVDYATDPDHVELVLLEEVRRAIGEVPGMLLEPAPVVRLHPGFGEYALQYTVACHVSGFGDTALAQHELRRRILKRLRAEGIEMPVPMRTVRLIGDGRGSDAARPLPDGREQSERAQHRDG
jgi:small-conductance mechanosensitive channel